MPIKVACQCGASFAAKDELAGKAVRCPKCKQPLKIPAPAAAAPTVPNAMDDLFDEVGIAAKKGPSCPQCNAELKPNAVLCVACGFDLQSGEHREGAKIHAVQLDGHVEAADTLLDRASRQIEIDKEEDKKNISQGAPAYVYLFGLLVIVAFATMMFTMPKGLAFYITGISVCCFAGLVNFYYGIRWLIVAFQEGPQQGFFHLIPIFGVGYQIYYLITRWDRVGKWFIAQLKMLPLVIFGGLLMLLGSALGFDYPKDDSRLEQEPWSQVACVWEFEAESWQVCPLRSV
ncbi:MAG: hypothetical protein H8E66_04215 [Planctomycetes bacterium]|nr:hypothetical protein [Planctomycetota bacterium]